MPQRSFRKCETCEWFEKQQERCHLIAYTRGSDSFYPGKNFWCSEWKSAEPETCGMCYWRKNEQERQNSEVRVERCRNLKSDREGQWINSEWGACEYFRRENAD